MTQWPAVEPFETRNTISGCMGSVRGSGTGGGISKETEVLQVGRGARKCLFPIKEGKNQLRSSEVVCADHVHLVDNLRGKKI